MSRFVASNRGGRFSGSRKGTRRALRFEGLEGRAMMSVAPASLGAATAIPAAELEDLSPQETAQLTGLAASGNVAAATGLTPPAAYVNAQGTLVIEGCAGDDWINVESNKGAPATVTQKVNGDYILWEQDFFGVKRIEFRGHEGANEFHNNTSLPSTAVGGSGVDQFFGGGGADTFYGKGGNDVLYGYGGSDKLVGGTGDDWLYAGEASECNTTNVLKGGAGADHLFGSGGYDKLLGGKGDDKLCDDTGDAYLDGGAGNDVLVGHDYTGTGKRLEMHGGAGTDKLVVKPAEYPWKLWWPGNDDYADDQIFLSANKSLKTLTEGDVRKLLS
jgi:Ca2+-binding RTX toxin-like protein